MASVLDSRNFVTVTANAETLLHLLTDSKTFMDHTRVRTTMANILIRHPLTTKITKTM